MIMQVHDELVFEVKADKIDHYSQLIKTEMEKAISLKVPLIAEVGVGENWTKLIKLYNSRLLLYCCNSSLI
ncbi:DNA polymerase I [Mannheimia haemolytica]|uniref:DNA-directed DNA polymerase n=1 Tax=Mannheimia haemolytica TaxID=75985 RepID=A0A378MYQ0_MANHA|nr:DNA polymerase I [Mannheimia haemolytica]